MDYAKWISTMVGKLRGDKTISEVAEAADISISHWFDIEIGRAVPTIATLDAMFRACGATLVLDFTMASSHKSDWLYVRAADIEAIVDTAQALLDEYTQEQD